MLRQLQPEILDALPPHDREAIASRRDLRWINAFMGNWRWLARVLRARCRPGDHVIEIGAGRGEFLRWWARVDPALMRHLTVDALDFAPKPDDWPGDYGWIQGDLLPFPGYGARDVVVANLVLHHFDAGALAELGRRLTRGPRVVIACEPARQRLHLWQLRLLPMLGANRVTRHDARVSVQAGFRDRELPAALGLDDERWRVDIATSWRGAYRMVATRRKVDS